MNESILGATIDQLRTAQAKITYLGTQSKPIPTVVFSTEGHHVDLQQFTSVQQLRKPYPNDELPDTMQFTVQPEEFRRILDTLKPVLAENDKASGPVILSFSVVRSTPTATGHEFRIHRDTARRFYAALVNALDAGNEPGRAALNKQSSVALPSEP